MQGDKGLETIEQFYYDVEPDFNEECGLHVHVDVRDFNDNQLFDLIKALKDTKNTWFSYVSSERWDNEYCYADLPEPTPYDSIHTYFNRLPGTRYAWCNLKSIREHGSIEFRLHEATDDVGEVVEWVTMLVNFVSEVKEMSNV